MYFVLEFAANKWQQSNFRSELNWTAMLFRWDVFIINFYSLLLVARCIYSTLHTYFPCGLCNIPIIGLQYAFPFRLFHSVIFWSSLIGLFTPSKITRVCSHLSHCTCSLFHSIIFEWVDLSFWCCINALLIQFISILL